MRVHSNQTNPNAQLDAMYASQKAAAKQEAARTRKKLSDSASKLAGEAASEACVVELREREESGEPPERQNQPNPGAQKKQKKQKERAASEEGNSSVSDWA
jgi:hypothetical protein